MRKQNHGASNKKFITPILIIFVISLSIYVTAVPSQPSITPISNTTSGTAGIGAASSGDKGGYISTITLNGIQQNYAWKAYVGNISGKLVLEDQAQYSIYEWSISTVGSGNIYISRNSSVTWGAVNCSNRTVIESEDTYLNLNSSNSNSINKTFNESVHKTFKISGVTYQNSTCPAISTYVNDTLQTNGEANLYQEVLLADSNSNLVYMTMIDPAESGFDNSLYDFQILVAENEATSLTAPITYYFYLELAG